MQRILVKENTVSPFGFAQLTILWYENIYSILVTVFKIITIWRIWRHYFRLLPSSWIHPIPCTLSTKRTPIKSYHPTSSSGYFMVRSVEKKFIWDPSVESRKWLQIALKRIDFKYGPCSNDQWKTICLQTNKFSCRFVQNLRQLFS